MEQHNARCAVIYHSRWGNCELVATALAAGLNETGHRPYLAETGSVAGLDGRLDAVFLGSPTGAARATRRMRLFIQRFVKEAQRGLYFSAFGTGLASRIERGGRQSADEIHALLVEKGLEPIGLPFRAAVSGLKGPLVQGELERAFHYGIELGTALSNKRRPTGRGDLELVI